MWKWLKRYHQRQRELRQGVDAYLARDNRRHWKLCGKLFGCSLPLVGVQAKVDLRDPWHSVAVALTMIFFIASPVLEYWARAESRFLNKPNPKERPRLWR
jgi:hypothetical protein